MKDIRVGTLDYNVEFDGLERMYPVNLDSVFDRNNVVSPKVLYYEDRLVSKSNKWVEVLVDMVMDLQTYKPKPLEELYSFEVDWSDREVFVDKENEHYTRVDDKLFMRDDFESYEYVWLIQSLMKFFKVKIFKSGLFVKIPQRYENEELQAILVGRVIEEFVIYLKEVNPKITIRSFNKILRELQKLDPCLRELDPNIKSIFLIDNKDDLEDIVKLMYGNKRSTSIKYYLDFFDALNDYVLEQDDM